MTDADRVKAVKANAARVLAQYESTPWEKLSLRRKRRRVIEEQHGKCLCGVATWQGKKLTLEYHHKNGDKGDNSRGNVCAVCPNCHSQTKNFRRLNRHTQA